jgi:hypothetical protein
VKSEVSKAEKHRARKEDLGFSVDPSSINHETSYLNVSYQPSQPLWIK